MTEAVLNISKPVIAVAVLDVSSSMEGESIEALRSALQSWVDSAKTKTWERVNEVLLAVVTFGGAHEVKVVTGDRTVGAGAFVHIGSFDPNELVVKAEGTTPLVASVRTAIELVQLEKLHVREKQKRQYFRPLIWLVTDGAPTDQEGQDDESGIKQLGEELRRDAMANHYTFFALGATNAIPAVLATLGAEPNVSLKLAGIAFDDIVRLLDWSIPKATLSPSETHRAVTDWIRDNYPELTPQ
jgi:uncharacterized protein YegL